VSSSSVSLRRFASAGQFALNQSRPLSDAATSTLMAAVEGYLANWNAHGEPLTAAYEWRFGRLLVVGVDQRSAGASGCSIDGLFRVLQELEPQLDARLVGALANEGPNLLGHVFDPGGELADPVVDRPEHDLVPRQAGLQGLHASIFSFRPT